MRNERGGIRDLNYSTQHAQRCDQPLTLTRPFVTQSQRRPIRSLSLPLFTLWFRAGANQFPGQELPCQTSSHGADQWINAPGNRTQSRARVRSTQKLPSVSESFGIRREPKTNFDLVIVDGLGSRVLLVQLKWIRKPLFAKERNRADGISMDAPSSSL
jgi:hypothetical protein